MFLFHVNFCAPVQLVEISGPDAAPAFQWMDDVCDFTCGEAITGNCGACPTGSVCDATLGCVQCLTNADCPQAVPACLAGACVECAANSDCGGNKVCDLVQQQCTNPCSANSCNGDAPICNPQTSACVQCLDSGDCAGPRSARNVLMHPEVDAAVFETARGGISRAETDDPTRPVSS